jgi:pimeloyl-ACP methyl ester carboxylesterase
LILGLIARSAIHIKREPALDHNYANANGVRLHYVTAGTGPVILFIHGFPEFWYAWRDQLNEFSRTHRAVALDMRGYNLSDKPADVEAYRAKHLVEDLRRFIDHLGARPCVVVAHDWGGAVAWNLASRHPDYLTRLVIINAAHPVPFARALKDNPEQIAASQYMLLFRDPKAERVLSENNFKRMEGLLRSDFGGTDGEWPTDDDLAHYRAAWSRPGALTGGLNYYRASPVHPKALDAPGATAVDLDPKDFMVKVPTLVIWGEKDQALRPVLLEGLDELVPDLTVKRIPHGSHWVTHERPDEVNRLIREFIHIP